MRSVVTGRVHLHMHHQRLAEGPAGFVAAVELGVEAVERAEGGQLGGAVGEAAGMGEARFEFGDGLLGAAGRGGRRGSGRGGAGCGGDVGGKTQQFLDGGEHFGCVGEALFGLLAAGAGDEGLKRRGHGGGQDADVGEAVLHVPRRAAGR